jgi:hypothetical protein
MTVLSLFWLRPDIDFVNATGIRRQFIILEFMLYFFGRLVIRSML